MYCSKVVKGDELQDVINQGQGGRGVCRKMIFLLIVLYSKSDDYGGWGDRKSQKNDDVFYEWLHR